MPPDERDAAYVCDILKAARLIGSFVADVTRQEFEQDPKTHYAVIAQLQIIGEAAKRVSEEFRSAHPDVPWSKMARMRDLLIHLYDRVDLGEVWRAACESVPQVVDQLERMLPSGEDAPAPAG